MDRAYLYEMSKVISFFPQVFEMNIDMLVGFRVATVCKHIRQYLTASIELSFFKKIYVSMYFRQVKKPLLIKFECI